MMVRRVVIEYVRGRGVISEKSDLILEDKQKMGALADGMIWWCG